MPGADDKLVRVRGGPKGFRLIKLGQWKDEIKARRAKPPKGKSRRDDRMQAKQKRRNKRGKKS